MSSYCLISIPDVKSFVSNDRGIWRRALAFISVFIISLGAIASGQTPEAQVMNPDLPPLLEFLDGSPVRTPEDWPERRSEVRRLMIETFTGTFPEPTPALLGAEVVSERQETDGSRRRRVRLTFDTPSRASFEICLWIPKGTGPFPVLLTVPVDWQVDKKCFWPQAALKRGYIACLYPGVSFTCNPAKGYGAYKTALGAFRKDYPTATMADIPGGAWIASRTLDYLLDPKVNCPIEKDQVAIIGHSRYGKQSLVAAAMDERIRAVVARSPGSPGSSPYRFTSRNTFAETPVDFPGDWFLRSLREYYGREQELPIDAHGWLGLIAPRPCLIHTAHNDGAEPTFAVERAYLAGRSVYNLLGRSDALRVRYREGGHNPTTQAHRMDNFDWFDKAFGRDPGAKAIFPEELIHAFDWDEWKAKQTEKDLEVPRQENMNTKDPAVIRTRIRWALGEGPTEESRSGARTFLTDAESDLMTHDRWKVKDTKRVPVSFGENIRGNIYFNPMAPGPAPVVIWLHPYSYHSGYNEGYGVQDTTVYHRLAQAGFVVLAYDQCGFGLRLLEGRDFYDNHPRWSRLGRMVDDVRSAVDFIVDGKGAAKSALPKMDSRRVYVLGYSVGGMTALYATALDKRITGVASFCGFTPLRTDTDAKATGGIRRLWEWHALQPKLGLFQGRESEIVYDFDDVLNLIAPRPCLIVSPQRDRDADFNDVQACVDKAINAWGAKGARKALTHKAPDDVNRFQMDQHRTFLEWVKKVEAPTRNRETVARQK